VAFQAGVPKQDVPRWLDRADLFLNTTNIDNTPVSVEEAMACGLCVISTNVGGVPYLVLDEKEALLVLPRDPDAMAGAVRRVLTEPGLAVRLSQAARQRAESMDWGRAVEEWERLLSSVACGAAGRARRF
jgi:glycosyltransferase involved in cell wall biosynthesis